MILMKESEMLQDNLVEVEKTASILVSKTMMMPLKSDDRDVTYFR